MDRRRRSKSPAKRRSRTPTKRRSKSPPKKKSRSKSPPRAKIPEQKSNTKPRSRSPSPKRPERKLESWEERAIEFLKSIGDEQAAHRLVLEARQERVRASSPIREHTPRQKPESSQQSSPPPMEPSPPKNFEERLKQITSMPTKSRDNSEAFAAFLAQNRPELTKASAPKATTSKKPVVVRPDDKAELRKLLGVILSMQELQKYGQANTDTFLTVLDEMGINRSEISTNRILQVCVLKIKTLFERNFFIRIVRL